MALVFEHCAWLGTFIVLIQSVITAQGPNWDDIYTFCGKGRSAGDNSACLGFCMHNQTICSSETGICSCTSPVTKLTNQSQYNCKTSKPRSRCHNACKTYTMITPRFRRGETKICEKVAENKRMCFCLPKV